MWSIITCLMLLGCSTFINCEIESFEKKGDQPCGGNNFTHEAQAFKLNPLNFTGECIWGITPNLTNATATTNLFIHFLYLHEDDVVTVFKDWADINDDNKSIIAPLRGRDNGSVTLFSKEKQLVIKLKGIKTDAYTRKFSGEYHGRVCKFQITPDIQIIHSPIHAIGSGNIVCKYTYQKDPHTRSTRSFIFEKFDMNSSEVSLSTTTFDDGLYKRVTPVDFFPRLNQQMEIDVTIPVPSNDSFCLRLHKVDSSCYMYKKFQGSDNKVTFDTPENAFNNGSIDVTECRYIFESSDSSNKLGVSFDKLNFEDALDIIAINDGGSELSPPLLQVTTSSANITKEKPIRTSGSLLWISFKPISYATSATVTVTAHSQGGYHKGSGNIAVPIGNTDDPVFLLEVEEGQIVLLKFTDSDIPVPAELSIYDGFDKSNLLTTLHGSVWYPILSKSNKMMLIASNFAKGKFSATFTGVSPSCLHMSTYTNENYILSGNCNASCIWIIPPQDQQNTDLLLDLQFLALSKNDQLKITKLDMAKTVLGNISSTVNHVPQLMIPANVGALVEISRAPCAKENVDVVLVGHSSYLPACGGDLTPPLHQPFQITSPLHPDTYPVFSTCSWKISALKDQLVHLAFHSLQLSPNHCVHVTRSADNKTETYEGSDMREDLFLMGEVVVEFDANNCKKVKDPLPLESAEGFVINGTVCDCGSVLSGKASGEFTVPANKSLCLWKVSIPETGEDTNNVVNIISYSITKNDDKGNYELQVYDGNTVRDSKIVNNSNSEIWSRTSNLIFIYKKTDAAKPSTLLTFKYNTISCNSTMQCDNGMCLHPDWRCNGKNECGDYSDERNCNSVPIPPKIELTGYSVQAFWGTVISMFVIGGLLGVGVPFCYQKYKNGQYRRFGEISIIE